jgi:glycerol-3-phosphate dehydrogenase (NAD(P)+)
VEACDTIIFAVPSAYAGEVLERITPDQCKGKTFVSAIKGILPETQQLLSDYLETKYSFPLAKYVAITGPCHAEEVAAERLSYLTFSGLDAELAGAVAKAFANDYIHTSHNHDIWGAQYAAVLKNIYAIGAGIAHALDYGDNFLSVYITACYREMYHFLKGHFRKIHPSDDKPDFHTSAYLGDLLVTCYSLHSRNRTFGAMIGKGYSVKAATLEMNMVAEGYNAARGMQKISEQYGLKIPIATRIYQILWEGVQARGVFAELESYLS